MPKIKDIIYNYLVKKNENVRYEYERYVMENTVEHYEKRLMHWKILFCLNWHYRICNKHEPLLYFCENEVHPVLDSHHNANKKNNASKTNHTTNASDLKNINKRTINKQDKLSFPESEQKNFQSPQTFATELLSYDIISFDMFDTLIFRCFDNPKDVFSLVGAELFIPNFKNIRSHIETEKRKNVFHGEITIEEIYDEISERFGINKQKGIELELAYELKSCYANPYMYELYKILKQYGKKIIVTSNMYLSKRYLELILNQCGYKEIDEIYVSCEYGLSKKNGGLQSKINCFLESGTKIIHVGDNYYMDVEGSRIAGWKAIYYRNVNVAGKNYRLLPQSNIGGSLFKGIVNAKLHNGLVFNQYYEYGYANVGFLVYGFCKWLNDIAKINNIDKFLFVSRDMFIVHKVYTKYFNKIESTYIKASRTSSIHLSFERHIEHFLDWHIKRRISSSIEMHQVLTELNLDFLFDFLGDFDLLSNEILTAENYDKVKALIYENKESITPTYQKEKQAARQYYADKVGNSSNVCIVDLGWKGSTANSLEYFLIDDCHMDIHISCALLGTEGHPFVNESLSRGKIFSYMFSSHANTDLMLEHNANGNVWRRIYEIIFTSNENSLLNFALQEDGKVKFEYLRKEIRNDEIVSNMHCGILDFVKDFYNMEKRLGTDLKLESRITYQPLRNIMKDQEYNLQLFKDFEVCFIAGNVKENNVELFQDVVLKGGK